jgi:peptidyl-prolyl cis-trans isomerase B (cyclophilin B)
MNALLLAAVLVPNPTTMTTDQLSQTAAPGAVAPAAGSDVAVLTTAHGRIVLGFRPDKAPNHVANFIKLSKAGFYDGTRFHRCIPGFMIQGGDPNTKDLAKSNLWGTGGPAERVDAEFNDLKHTRGVLSMARSSDPDSAGSQFFLMVADSPHLDGSYSAFGIVLEGMDVLDKIVKTGAGRPNGSVEPDQAVLLERVEIKTWPLGD